MTATPSFDVNPDIREGQLIRILRSGVTKTRNAWCSVNWADGSGKGLHVALAASEEFDLDLLSHGIGLKWKFKARPSKRYPVEYRCLPLAEQPVESIQEAMARKRGEETATPDPVTVDCPADAVVETKLIKLDQQDQMLNDQHWNLYGKVEKHENWFHLLAYHLGLRLPDSSDKFNPDEFTKDPEDSF